MDDQQRARDQFEEWCKWFATGIEKGADGQYIDGLTRALWCAWQAATAALRAAPEVGDSYVVLQRVDVKRLLSGDENSPGYELSRRRVTGCLAARQHVSLSQADLERINEAAARPQGVG